MDRKINLTQERIRYLLDYNPETGLFRWKFRVDKGDKYNKRWAGREASCYDAYGYKVIRIDSYLYKAHRIAWLYVYGQNPNYEIDHINLDKSDNRIYNLREATPHQNSSNSPRKSNNTSGYKGVQFKKQNMKWQAIIQHKRKVKHLGFFNDPESAYEAYCKAAKEIHGEYARVA